MQVLRESEPLEQEADDDGNETGISTHLIGVQRLRLTHEPQSGNRRHLPIQAPVSDSPQRSLSLSGVCVLLTGILDLSCRLKTPSERCPPVAGVRRVARHQGSKTHCTPVAAVWRYALR